MPVERRSDRDSRGGCLYVSIAGSHTMWAKLFPIDRSISGIAWPEMIAWLVKSM